MLTEQDIKIHLASGRYYERPSTCGKKIKWLTFERANQEAIRLTKLHPKNPKEAYPCYFCSPDIPNNDFTWHVGRTMEDWEKAAFAKHADRLLGMEDVYLNGVTPIRVHNRKLCEGRNCCIHNPSDHHMVTWQQNWRADRKIMERMCPHGVGHPDPDDADFRASIGDTDTVHGCDGCC